jgi:hypothetical protein
LLVGQPSANAHWSARGIPAAPQRNWVVEVAIVHRSAEGTPERLAGFVAELVGNPVIAVVGGFSAKAARATTPIALRPVMTQLERQRRKPPLGCVRSRHDPVAAGPLRSFA